MPLHNTEIKMSKTKKHFETSFGCALWFEHWPIGMLYNLIGFFANQNVQHTISGSEWQSWNKREQYFNVNFCNAHGKSRNTQSWERWTHSHSHFDLILHLPFRAMGKFNILIQSILEAASSGIPVALPTMSGDENEMYAWLQIWNRFSEQMANTKFTIYYSKNENRTTRLDIRKSDTVSE